MNKAITMLILCLSLLGCAARQPLDDRQVFEQYPIVTGLKNQLEAEQDNELALLSPRLFAKANELYNDSLELARADNAKANTKAKEGIDYLSEARKTAAINRDLFEEVLVVRNNAIQSKATQAKPEAFKEAEDSLLRLTTLVEKGQIESAKAGRSEVMREYSAIELASIKVNIVDDAKVVIQQAKKDNVDHYAPKTMRQAEEDYQLALDTLDANRNDTGKANLHAQRAIWNARRATVISDIIAHFRYSDFEEEDKILWYQDQISRIVAPLEKDVGLDTANKDMVKKLSAKLEKLVSDNNKLQLALDDAWAKQMMTAQEKEMQLQKLIEQSEAEKQHNQLITSKFNFVQALFDSSEAEVYRQANNVLIRARGFAFKTGDSEIDTINFGLLNKIIKAIEQFPNSKVIVTGHTDNRGGDEINLAISNSRANNVAKFLSEVGRIDATRISSAGYGKIKPVADNETEEGRAANRRVEILIVNEEGVL